MNDGPCPASRHLARRARDATLAPAPMAKAMAIPAAVEPGPRRAATLISSQLDR